MKQTIRFKSFPTAILLVIFGWLISAQCTSLAHAQSAQPNIIIIMPDDAGYGDYASLGSPIIHTPMVDAFKEESLLFTQFHVSPKCSPTRAALMSGRHEFKNGVTHTVFERERLSLETVTISQMLQEAGYATGIFGKWHLGDEAPYRPENRGFDEVYIHAGGGIGQTFPGSCGDAPGNSNINPALWHNGIWEKKIGYSTDLFFEQALQWMNEKREKNEPFFTYLPLNAAHGPYIVPEKYYQHYLGLPGVDEETAKFYGMLENVDTNFGELLLKLEDWGISDNTLVIFMGSDNGGTKGVPIFNAGMREGKGSPYQGGTRVPMFVRWPKGGILPNTETDALTAHIDIFPTLAEVAGAKLPTNTQNQLDGISLVPLLKNPESAWEDRTLVHHFGNWAQGKASESKYRRSAIQNSRFTLVNNTELYDLKADRGENKNVISEHPEVVAELRAIYELWWMEVQPLLINEDKIGPKINPMKELYWKQFGGEPDEELLNRMDPNNAVKMSQEIAERNEKNWANKAKKE
ncbi:arylsulfatase [Echinicola pacifica]|nr:arylsulfatase [Echinicola pacifica]